MNQGVFKSLRASGNAGRLFVAHSIFSYIRPTMNHTGAFFQEASADKFCQENAQRVDGAAYKDIGFSDKPVNGWYDNCASVYGKHVQ